MFYAHFVLAKKGPLARIWLAAHWDKKLTKAHVFETNIEKSVDGILQPKVKMALRTSGHLLLGVVRIYSRKAKYLLADCNEAFVKIKMAFRPGMVDLPEDIREAAVSAITFPEVFHDFDTPMPELNDVDIQAQFTLNQSRAEEITMREDYGNISLVTGDDGFGDIGFEEPSSLIRASGIDQNLDQTNIFGENVEKVAEENSIQEQNERLSTTRANASDLDINAPIKGDGFGGNIGQDIMSGGLFEGGLFDDTPIDEAPPLENGQLDKEDKIPEDSDDDGPDLDRFNGPPSVGPSSTDGGSPYQSPGPDKRRDALNVAAALPDGAPAVDANDDAGIAADQTTLLQNEEESFALEPIDSTTVKAGWPKTKRKRKLIVDEVKNISGEEMKAQLSDTSDIVTTLDLAPPSKRLMHWKETGGVEKLFALPGRSMNAQIMHKMYVRHLTSEHSHNEDFGMAGDAEIDNFHLEQVREEVPPAAEIIASAPRPRGRPPKRKYPDDEDEVGHPPSKSKEECFNELLASRKSSIPSASPLHPEASFNDMPPPQPLDETPQEVAHTTNSDKAHETELPHSEPQNEIHDHHEEDMGMADLGSPQDDHLHMDDHGESEVHQGDDDDVPHDKLEVPHDKMEVIHDNAVKKDAVTVPQEDKTIHEGDTSFTDKGGNDSVMHNNDPFSPPADHPFSPGRGEDGDGDIEEQAEDETYEEFEERVVNKRAGLMFKNIKKSLRIGSMPFNDLAHGNNRKQVAQKFYTMLVLKKLQAVELVQEEGPYGAIHISRGTLFEKAAL